MTDEDNRRIIRALCDLMVQFAEQQEQIQASVRALQAMVMQIKGLPAESYKDFLASLAPIEAQFAEASPNAQGASASESHD